MLKLLCFALLFSPSLLAAEILPSREVSLEWEVIQGAASYEVEVKSKNAGSKPQVFTSQEAVWMGRLSPGYYEMKVRARDRRKVPGDWSESIDLTVLLEPPMSKTLKSELNLSTKGDETTEYTLNWEAVPGAQSYQVKTTTEDGKVLQTFDLKEQSVQIELPVATKVKWSVLAIGPSGLTSEYPLTGEMSVWGPELENMEINKPTSPFVREVSWPKVEFAQSYTYALQRFDPAKNKWQTVYSEKSSAEPVAKFSASWPGGKYRINARATAPLRKSSKVTSLSFDVIDGDRSATAEYKAMLRKSIVRTTGWFAIASYLITKMNYQGVNADNLGLNSLRVSLPDNLGGTGRIGAGYLSDQSPWGFLGVVDMSGFIVEDKKPTFATVEVNGVHRMVVGADGEFRQQFGVFYKEIPEIIAYNLNRIDRIDKIIAAGPHYGVEYWLAMSPKLGLQVNAHLYASSVSIKTPNGNAVKPSMSYQLGLLGSYRFSEKGTGLLGYAYRDDSLSYESTSGRKNSVNITGHYLNLFLEWAL